MRNLTKTLSLAVVAAAATTAGAGFAHAADMPVEYAPIIEAPAPLPLAAVGGWYLRGDIGYKVYNAPSGGMSNNKYGGSGGPPSNVFPYAVSGRDQMINEKMLGALDIGVGAGYKFNDYLRADLTLDYETPAKFKGSLWCVTACGAAGYYDTERVKIDAWSALANLYADLGNFHGITPYVGAGAGLSYLTTSSVQSSNKDTSGPAPAGASTWNFAWALMAGVEYPVSDRLSLDLGYRYLNLGDAKTGYVTDGSTPAESTRMEYNDISAHEVRIGLRYYLN